MRKPVFPSQRREAISAQCCCCPSCNQSTALGLVCAASNLIAKGLLNTSTTQNFRACSPSMEPAAVTNQPFS
jgi:hypothetical protein